LERIRLYFSIDKKGETWVQKIFLWDYVKFMKENLGEGDKGRTKRGLERNRHKRGWLHVDHG